MPDTHAPVAWWPRPIHALAGWPPISPTLAATLHRLDGPLLRYSQGRFSLGSLLTGLPIVMLTTVGAKSRQPRRLPLVGIPAGEDIILIASNWGQTRHPAWHYNARANPVVRLTRAGRTRPYLAHETEGEERAACWRQAVAQYAGYAAYEARAGDRLIPVWRLTPLPEPDGA